MKIPVRLPIEQTDPPRSPQETLPTMYDLPSEDPEEPGLPDEFHLWQAELLSQTFRPPQYAAEQIFVASDLNLYYDFQNTGWYKRPDWFAVVGVPRLYQKQELRLSYVIWQEGVRPIVAVELLSPGTQDEDLGKREAQGKQPGKWKVYEQILGVPYYVTFNRYSDELQAFQLVGDRYQKMDLSGDKVWLESLKLGLALWQGEYRGASRQWLRWYNAQGNLVPTQTEMVQQAEQRTEQERQQKELAERRVQELAQRLRDLGLEP